MFTALDVTRLPRPLRTIDILGRFGQEPEMKKTAYALALVTLILIGAYPLLAAEMAPSCVTDRGSQIVASTHQSLRTQNAGVFSLAGDFGWMQPSLATHAYAGTSVVTPTHRLALAEKNQQQVPFTTGAWLMGCGLVAFIISRKRFRT